MKSTHFFSSLFVTDPYSSFLPYGRQSIDEDDVAAVVSALKSGWLTTGPAVEQLETDFASKTGARHAVACANGTTALHLTALALQLGPGDCVVVPSMTFLATANAVRYVGAEVIFADVDADTGLLTPAALQAALDDNAGKNIKAVFPVHLNGQCADMVGISAIAKANGLAVVEDACHAIGGTHLLSNGQNVSVGSCALSDMVTFSLHPVKSVTMGEGGLITSNDDALNERLRLLRNHGMTRNPERLENTDLAFDENGEANPWYYEMQNLGFNYRASDIHCALGASQLKKLDGFIKRRAELVALYDRHLAPLADLIKPVIRTGNGKPAWHLYVVHIDFSITGFSRAHLIHELAAMGIGTQVHYLPLHKQPYYQKRYGELNLPGADSYYQRCLSLPLYPDMQDSDVARVCDSLRTAMKL